MIEILLQAEGALSVGLLDRAEDLYRQVAEADPRNSIAVVGLARVALERGDEPRALNLARRALAIDPENAAAQRMVRRLEEVLTFRGGEAPGAEPTNRTSASSESPLSESPLSESPPVASAVAEPPPPGPAPSPAPDDRPAPTPTDVPRRRSLVDRLLRRG